jgi:2-polyprenyl-3-methyl-5-hydroxy-6-metoxy-1,4-benzoquinol methylase
MTAQDRVRWDQVYKAKHDDFPPPDPLLFEFTPPVEEDTGFRALDVAAGLGQNGMWLAAQGYTVDMIDVSRVALLKAQEEMGRRKLRTINLYQVDLDTYEIPVESYELVCVFRFLARDLFPKLRNAVRPGGRILYQTFNTNYLETVPDFNPAYMLGVGELAGYFADWKILHNNDGKQMSSLVALKP